jgi:hypothetical protein
VLIVHTPAKATEPPVVDPISVGAVNDSAPPACWLSAVALDTSSAGEPENVDCGGTGRAVEPDVAVAEVLGRRPLHDVVAVLLLGGSERAIDAASVPATLLQL